MSMTRRYAVTQLGSLGGNRTTGSALNKSGQVVGASFTADGLCRAFLYDGARVHDLGGLFGGGASSAADINDAGLIVGHVTTETDEGHAAYWFQGTLHDLGTLGGEEGYASAVNNLGQIVGASSLSAAQSRPKSQDELPFVKAEDTHAFLWQEGIMRDLGASDGDYSEASCISDAGNIGGSVVSAASHIRAFVIDPRAGECMRLLDPLPGGGYSAAHAIDSVGRVIGGSTQADGTLVPVEFVGGLVTAFGYPPGVSITKALAVNKHGEMVGYADPLGRHKRALYWHNDELIDLNEVIQVGPGWVLTEANDINDAGQIVVNGERLDRQGAFLLTPIPQD